MEFCSEAKIRTKQASLEFFSRKREFMHRSVDKMKHTT